MKSVSELIEAHVAEVFAAEAAIIEEAVEIAITTPPAGIGVRVQRKANGRLAYAVPDSSVPPWTIHEHWSL